MCPPGLHITLGIFFRLFCLLEDECHKLDLKVATESSAAEGGPSYSRHVDSLKTLMKLKDDLEGYSTVCSIQIQHHHCLPLYRLREEIGHQKELISLLLVFSEDLESAEDDPQLGVLIDELQNKTRQEQKLVSTQHPLDSFLTPHYRDNTIDE